MKKIQPGKLFFVMLISLALLLGGCGSASRSFYYSGNDDPLGLRAIQGRFYEARMPDFGQIQTSNGQEEQNATDASGNDGSAGNAENNETALAESNAGASDSNQAETDSSDGAEGSGRTGNSDETSGNETLDSRETSDGSETGNTEETDGTAGTADEDASNDHKSTEPYYDEEYQKENYALGAKILDEIGWDLKAAYDWCVAISYFNGTPIDAGLGTKWYADLGFETHRGNCYTYAATLTVMARLLGYEARQVDGHIKGYEELHHSWVEIDIDGVTYTCDPEYEWERGKSGYLKAYGEEGIWLLNSEELAFMPDDPTDESLVALEEAGWPITGPYAQFIQYWEYQIYLANQRNQDSEESDPNTGCIGDDVPEQ